MIMEAGFCETSTKQNGVTAQKRVIFKTIITATFACVTTMNLLQPHKKSTKSVQNPSTDTQLSRRLRMCTCNIVLACMMPYTRRWKRLQCDVTVRTK